MLIRKQIWFAGIVMLFAAASAIYFLTSFLVEPRLYKQEADTAQIRAELIAKELQGILNATSKLTQDLALVTELYANDRDTLIEVLPSLINSYGDAYIAGGGVWPEPYQLRNNVERDSLFWARSSNGQLELLDDYNDPSSGYHNEGWYTIGRTLNNGKCAWSEAYADAFSGTPMVTCTVAIQPNGRFWGVATIDLMLGGLNDLLESAQQATSGYPFVMDQLGTIVAAPKLRTKDLSMQPLKDLAQSDQSLQPLLEKSQSSQSKVDLPADVIPEGKALFVQTILQDQGWKVGLIIPHKVSLATTRTLVKTLYGVLLPIIGIFVALLIFYGQRILVWMNETTDQIRALINGQIDKRLTITRKDEIGDLRQTVNEYADYFSGILDRISNESESVHKSSNELNDLSTALTARAQTQLQENTTLSKFVGDMAISSREVASNTAESASTADDAVDIVKQGQRFVEESNNSMSKLADALGTAANVIERLAEDSQQVGEVLAVIKAISEQTNLLALNAAIEAARAGEQGRGFAVVADEVRTLAARTQSSADEIEKMITQLQNAARSGVEVIETSSELSTQALERAEETRKNFHNIVSAFSNIRDRATTIATAVEEQTQVSEEINKMVEVIRVISDENAQAAKDLSSMSHNYTKVAERLRDISRQQ